MIIKAKNGKLTNVIHQSKYNEILYKQNKEIIKSISLEEKLNNAYKEIKKLNEKIKKLEKERKNMIVYEKNKYFNKRYVRDDLSLKEQLDFYEKKEKIELNKQNKNNSDEEWKRNWNTMIFYSDKVWEIKDKLGGKND